KSVLGAIMIDSGAISLVAEFLRPKFFYSNAHRLIYTSMLRLFEDQSPIDIVTLKNQLSTDGTLKYAGGASYLSDLLNSVPTSAYVEQYGNIVKALYTKRKLIDVASRSVEKAFAEKGDIKQLIDDIESEIFSLAQEHQHRDFIPLKEILADSFEKLE
ncbi:MAG: replicative DNA helicase, partial [Candidatus Pacebacteria bacterium]|nr:replicative DNA helicase [Candidatus Paceibacterota bacterium]